MKRLVFFLTIILILVTACSSQQDNTASKLDIIPFIRVYHGDSTTVLLSDLFMPIPMSPLFSGVARNSVSVMIR